MVRCRGGAPSRRRGARRARRPSRGCGRHPVDDGGELVLQEEESGTGVLEDVADLGRGEPPVDGDEHRAALGAAEEDLVVVLGLLAQVGDPVARGESGGDQGVGDAVALAVQLPVGQRAPLAQDRGGVGPAPRVEARGPGERPELRVVEPVRGHEFLSRRVREVDERQGRHAVAPARAGVPVAVGGLGVEERLTGCRDAPGDGTQFHLPRERAGIDRAPETGGEPGDENVRELALEEVVQRPGLESRTQSLLHGLGHEVIHHLVVADVHLHGIQMAGVVDVARLGDLELAAGRGTPVGLRHDGGAQISAVVLVRRQHVRQQGFVRHAALIPSCSRRSSCTVTR